MATESSRNRMQDWARIGAERRLQELRLELAQILKAFPELRSPGLDALGAGKGRRGAKKGAGAAVKASSRKRKRPQMSAAQRKAVSERMKKFWAARRKAKG